MHVLINVSMTVFYVMLSALGFTEQSEDSPWDSEVPFYYYFKIKARSDFKM